MIITMTSEKEKADENVLVVLLLSRGQEPTQYTLYNTQEALLLFQEQRVRKGKGTFCSDILYLLMQHAAMQ